MGKGNERNNICPCGCGKKTKMCCLNYGVKNQFYLPKELYGIQLMPMIKNRKRDLKTIIEIQVVLPFHLPIEDSNILDYADGQDMVVFRFEEVTVKETYNYGFSVRNETKNITKTRVTIAIIVTIEQSKILEDVTRYCDRYLGLILQNLNKSILSYMITYKDEDCYYITKNMLEFNNIANVISMENWEVYKKKVFINSEKEKNTKALVSIDKGNYMEISQAVVYDKNPFIPSYQYELFAKRYLGQGLYRESVINSQTSVEIIIKTIFRMILESEGRSNRYIEKQMRKSIVGIVKYELDKYLKDSWGTEFVDWKTNTNELRNKVIHAGKQPTYEEAYNAVESATKFKVSVERRVKLTKSKYPEIASLFIYLG